MELTSTHIFPFLKSNKIFDTYIIPVNSCNPSVTKIAIRTDFLHSRFRQVKESFIIRPHMFSDNSLLVTVYSISQGLIENFIQDTGWFYQPFVLTGSLTISIEVKNNSGLEVFF